MNDIPDVLARICADTLAEVDRRRVAMPVAALKHQIAAQRDKPRGFARAINEAATRGYGLIAEIKRASPSGGLIREDFDPATLARAYRDGGATCLSVLTDHAYFQGAPDHLRAARAAVDLPVLRKDFMLDPWQIYESRALGADCVLLIMAALTDTQAVELEELARGLDMDVLVEVHDRAELDRALGLQTKLVGINNRNLRTMQTDIATTVTLAEFVPPDRFLVSESGIKTHADVQRLAAIGTSAFLVGEALMREPDVTQAVRDLLGR